MEQQIETAFSSISMHQILVFLKVAEEGGFLKASTMLHISQAAVSKSVAKLEKDLELKLFERTTRELRITPEGKKLYDAWSVQVSHMKKTYREVMELKLRKEHTLQIGLANTTSPEKYFWGLQERFQNKHPDMELKVNFEYMDVLAMKLKQGEYDIVMVPDFERFELDDLGLSWKWMAKTPAYALMSRHHRFADRKKLKFEELLEEEYICLKNQSSDHYAQDLRERFAKYHREPNIVQTVDSAFYLKTMFRPKTEIILVDDYFDAASDPEIVKVPIEDEQNGIICAWDMKNEKTEIHKLLNLIG